MAFDGLGSGCGVVDLDSVQGAGGQQRAGNGFHERAGQRDLPLAARRVRADSFPNQAQNAGEVRPSAHIAGRPRGRMHLDLAGLATRGAVPAGREFAVGVSVTLKAEPSIAHAQRIRRL